MNSENKKGTSAGWYALGGAVVGAAVALLLAPKAGKELRTDLQDLGQRGNGTAKKLVSKLKEYLPKTSARIEEAVAANGRML